MFLSAKKEQEEYSPTGVRENIDIFNKVILLSSSMFITLLIAQQRVILKINIHSIGKATWLLSQSCASIIPLNGILKTFLHAGVSKEPITFFVD